MPDFVARRYWYFLLSALVLVPGFVALALWGLRLAIDFTGGTLWEIRFERPVSVEAVRTALRQEDALIQSSEDNAILVRSKTLDEGRKRELADVLEGEFGAFEELRFESVGPAVGREVTQRATWAVAAAAVAILGYITWAFRRVATPLRYGVAAIVAMLHDVGVMVGAAALLGHFRGWEVDGLFLTALLTVIGFSVHDTIVVFDRIRENLVRHRTESFDGVVNHSITQTLDRSINTQLTLIFTLAALLVLGGSTIQHFIAFLLVGVVSGTYSSIFNAAQLLVVWEKGDVSRLVARLRGGEAPA